MTFLRSYKLLEIERGPFGRTPTRRTDLDLGAMRRHFDPDRRHIEHLAFFIPPHLTPLQVPQTTHTPAHLVRQAPVEITRPPQALPYVARRATIHPPARLP